MSNRGCPPLTRRYINAVHLKQLADTTNKFRIEALGARLGQGYKALWLTNYSITGNGSTLPSPIYARIDFGSSMQTYTCVTNAVSTATAPRTTQLEMNYVGLFANSRQTDPRLINEHGTWANGTIVLEQLGATGTMVEFTDYTSAVFEFAVDY